MDTFATLQSRFIGETGRINAVNWFKSHITRDGFRRHIPFLQWEDEMGLQYSFPKIEPNIIDQTVELTPRVLSAGDGTTANPNPACDPSPTRIGNGVSLIQVSLGDKVIESETFCVEDLRTNVGVQQQLAGYIETINQGVFFDMGLTLRKLHFAKSTTVYVCTDDGSGNTVLTKNDLATQTSGHGGKDDPANTLATQFSSFGGCQVRCTNLITADNLRDVYAPLISVPQGDTVFGYNDAGEPVWPCIVDFDINPVLIRDKTSLIRADVQFAWEGSEEMSPLFKSMLHPFTINGFATEPDTNMPRFTWITHTTGEGAVAGHYQVVYKYTTVATGNKGTKAVLNPDWVAAPYGLLCVPTYGAFDILVPAPRNYEGWFIPQSYIGDFRPLNEPYFDVVSGTNKNQDRTQAWLRAKYSMAARSMFPEQLVWIISLRPGKTAPAA